MNNNNQDYMFLNNTTKRERDRNGTQGSRLKAKVQGKGSRQMCSVREMHTKYKIKKIITVCYSYRTHVM